MMIIVGEKEKEMRTICMIYQSIIKKTGENGRATLSAGYTSTLHDR